TLASAASRCATRASASWSCPCGVRCVPSTTLVVITAEIRVDPHRAESAHFDRTLCARGASVQPGTTRASARRGVHLDAVEQGFERRVVDLDVARAFGPRLGQAEGAPIEPLVKNAHPAAVEEQNLERVASAPVEDEERAAARLVADLLLGNARQPVERAAQVDRIERHEHLHPLRDHRSSPSALTTRRSSASSKPARTATRAAPTATMIESSTRDWLRTTRAIRTRGWRFFGAAAPT